MDGNLIVPLIVALASAGIIATIAATIRWNRKRRLRDKIYDWLDKNVEDMDGKRFRSTGKMASKFDLTEREVEELCSSDKRIHRSTGDDRNMWTPRNRPWVKKGDS